MCEDEDQNQCSYCQPQFQWELTQRNIKSYVFGETKDSDVVIRMTVEANQIISSDNVVEKGRMGKDCTEKGRDCKYLSWVTQMMIHSSATSLMSTTIINGKRPTYAL